MTMGKHDLLSDLVQLVFLRLESVPWQSAEDGFSPVQQLFSLMNAMAPLGSGLTRQGLDYPGGSCFVNFTSTLSVLFSFDSLLCICLGGQQPEESFQSSVENTGVRHTW